MELEAAVPAAATSTVVVALGSSACDVVEKPLGAQPGTMRKKGARIRTRVGQELCDIKRNREDGIVPLHKPGLVTRT